jgi:aspartate/methionine/tyrosine aminotransferase
MHAVLKAGDHIIVQSPCYQSLFEVARSIGCQITKWQTREENDWALDPSDLQDFIQPNTKVVVINTPHNPTGYHMSPEVLHEINRIVCDNDLILFSDEVYRESEYQESDRLPAACDFGAHAISLGVMSKTYGLAGLRIGWIATLNSMIYNKMQVLKDYTTICSSAPSEFLAEIALRHRQVLAKRNIDIIIGNLVMLDEFFGRHRETFVWQRPKAGPIAFPRLIGNEISAFCDELVQASSVLLLPGTIFDDQENHFRIGFGRKNLPDALTRLDEFLHKQ